jgi:hypothetical protein
VRGFSGETALPCRGGRIHPRESVRTCAACSVHENAAHLAVAGGCWRGARVRLRGTGRSCDDARWPPRAGLPDLTCPVPAASLASPDVIRNSRRRCQRGRQLPAPVPTRQAADPRKVISPQNMMPVIRLSVIAVCDAPDIKVICNFGFQTKG